MKSLRVRITVNASSVASPTSMPSSDKIASASFRHTTWNWCTLQTPRPKSKTTTLKRTSSMARWSSITSCDQDPAQLQTPSKSCKWKAYPSKHPKCKGLLYTGRFVRKTISSPLLTHKIANKLSVIGIYVLVFFGAYLRPNGKLTEGWTNFASKGGNLH